MFVDLPCDEPDPVRRLRQIHAATSDRKRAGEPEGGGRRRALARLRSLAASSGVVSRLIASPRDLQPHRVQHPGPPEPLYMHGCPLAEAYPVVPIPERHALSIGVTTVGEGAFFGALRRPRVAARGRRARRGDRPGDRRARRAQPRNEGTRGARADPRLIARARGRCGAPRVGCRSVRAQTDPALEAPHGDQQGWCRRLRPDGPRDRPDLRPGGLGRRGARGEPGEARRRHRQDREAARPRGREGQGWSRATPTPCVAASSRRSTTPTSPTATS